MAAIRCVQTLEDHLPDGFPEPSEISLAHRPYDLEVVWRAVATQHVNQLRSRIAGALDCDGKWYVDGEGSLICKSRVSIGGKATLNLIMRIEAP